MAAASTSGASSSHKDLEPVLDWTKLAREDDLELMQRNGEVLTTGRVDMIALDGSVLWLHQDDGKGRAMFLPSEDYMVLRHRKPGKGRKTGR